MHNGSFCFLIRQCSGLCSSSNTIQNNDEIITNYQEYALKLGIVSSPIWRHIWKQNKKFFRRLPNIQFIDAVIRKGTSTHYIPFPVCLQSGVSRRWERRVEYVVFQRTKLDQWTVWWGFKHLDDGEWKEREVFSGSTWDLH